MPLRSTSRLTGVLLLFAFVALPASAQRMRTERIRFDRGEIAAGHSALIARGASVRYLVNVQRGQRLSAEASRDEGSNQVCTLAVYAPGRAIRRSNAAPSANGVRTGLHLWTGTLSRAGDYQVVVTNSGPTGTCNFSVAAE